MAFKEEKVKSLIKRLAADFLSEESNRQSLITVTSVSISPNLKEVIIGISVFPEEKEAEALEFLKRKRTDFRDSIRKKISLRLLPRFDFEIDKGEKNRQKIEALELK